MFQLAPLLTGKAQQAYAALSVDDAHDYAWVKESMQYCVGMTLVMRHTDRGLPEGWRGLRRAGNTSAGPVQDVDSRLHNSGGHSREVGG